MKRIANFNSYIEIKDRTEFQGNNLKGIWVGERSHFDLGRLASIFQPYAKSADYVVYSYGTPIAWYTQGRWFIPAVSYSTTTSKHQSYVNRAVALEDQVTVLAYDKQALKDGKFEVVEYPFDNSLWKKVRV